MAEEQFYALCVENDTGDSEIAFFELGNEHLLGALGISLYGSPDGELQRRYLQGEQEHLQDEQVLIAARSHEELLDAITTGVPSSVFLDGRRIAGSVFKAVLEEELGLPLHQPKLVRLDEPDLL
jgi:hypothetical protein